MTFRVSPSRYRSILFFYLWLIYNLRMYILLRQSLRLFIASFHTAETEWTPLVNGEFPQHSRPDSDAEGKVMTESDELLRMKELDYEGLIDLTTKTVGIDKDHKLYDSQNLSLKNYRRNIVLKLATIFDISEQTNTQLWMMRKTYEIRSNTQLFSCRPSSVTRFSSSPAAFLTRAQWSSTSRCMRRCNSSVKQRSPSTSIGNWGRRYHRVMNACTWQYLTQAIYHECIFRAPLSAMFGTNCSRPVRSNSTMRVVFIEFSC